MSIIKLDNNEVSALIDAIKKAMQKLDEYKNEIQNIRKTLDWEVSSKEDVDGRLRKIGDKIVKQYEILDSFTKVLKTLTEEFTGFEQSIKSSVDDVIYSLDKVMTISNMMKILGPEEAIRIDLLDRLKDIGELFKLPLMVTGVASVGPKLLEALGENGFKLKYAGDFYKDDEWKDPFEGKMSISKELINAKGSVLSGDNYDVLGYEAKSNDTLSFNLKDGEVGAKIDATLEGYLAKGEAESQIGVLSLEGEGKLGVGTVKGEAGVAIFSDGEFKPELNLEAKAEVSGIYGKGSATVGNDQYNVHAGAKGSLGYAGAEAKVGMGADGLTAKASAEAYAAKGEVSGGFTVLGIKVDVVGEGKAGGAGVKGGFGADSNGFEVEGGLGVLVGVGGKLKVDWSGFEWPSFELPEWSLFG